MYIILLLIIYNYIIIDNIHHIIFDIVRYIIVEVMIIQWISKKQIHRDLTLLQERQQKKCDKLEAAVRDDETLFRREIHGLQDINKVLIFIKIHKKYINIYKL